MLLLLVQALLQRRQRTVADLRNLAEVAGAFRDLLLAPRFLDGFACRRASSIDATIPAPIACVIKLPMAVASAGPATTRRPVASAVN